MSLFSSTDQISDGASQETGEQEVQHKPGGRSSLLKNLGGLLKRTHEHPSTSDGFTPSTTSNLESHGDELALSEHHHDAAVDVEAPPRRAIASLSRPQPHRQESERRERLLEVRPNPAERRGLSTDRRRAFSASASQWPPSLAPPSTSTISLDSDTFSATPASDSIYQDQQSQYPAFPHSMLDIGPDNTDPLVKGPLTNPTDTGNQNYGPLPGDDDDENEIDLSALQVECDRRWILNISMHFRDESNREKFFVTYAETATKWRRVTVSLDYRNAPPGSLETDLKSLKYQRDKSFRIYEAIHESLPDIQFYPTVTNLRLKTTTEDGQLHVHVREDANEIIQYPSISLFGHIDSPRIPENEIRFDSHLSGYVYQVSVHGMIMIKKEIPGPETMDEFCYEVNALDSLLDSDNVVQLKGLVTDDKGEIVKGLLIAFASRGALVDLLYDFRRSPELPWHRREKWAKQIVKGLLDIHEAGFVQGDFTLSNIVVDAQDNAQIIDINRRGCPVGWEPPELSRLIDSGQRISMCIGVKTDLFQLGMVLWALAEEVDDPERIERPLPTVLDSIPRYFRDLIETCLSDRPQDRASAKELLAQFPPTAGQAGRPAVDFAPSVTDLSSQIMHSSHRSDKEYIDPDLAVTLDDVNARHNSHRDLTHRPARRGTETSAFTSGQVTYVDPDEEELAAADAAAAAISNADPRNQHSNPASTSYRFGSSGSWIVGLGRGRSSNRSPSGGGDRRRPSSPFSASAPSSTTSRSRSPPSRSRARCGSLFSEVVGNQGAGDESGDSDGGKDERNRAMEVFKQQHQGKNGLLHMDSGFDEVMAEDVEKMASAAAPARREGKI